MGVSGLSNYLKNELAFDAEFIDDNNNSNINNSNNSENNNKVYKGYWRPAVAHKTDHVFIDMNGILHKQLHRVSDSIATLDKVKTEVVSLIRNYIKTSGVFQNTKSIQFIFDGPGSRSKILLQRKRRLKNITDAPINSSLITPGTVFMGEMKQLLLDFSKKLLRETRNPHLKDIHVSGSDRWGEGEFKIFEHINSMNWKENIDVSIFTCDSDTILYSLLSDANIKVYDLYNPRKYKDISKLKSILANLVPHREKRQVVIDFVFLNLFRGNDLLPSLTDYNFESVWQSYITSKETDGLFNLDSSEINWDLLLSVLAQNRVIVSGPQKISVLAELRAWMFVLGSYLQRSDKLEFKMEMVTVPDQKHLVDVTVTIDGHTFQDRVKSDAKTKNRFLIQFFDIDHPFWAHYKPHMSQDQIDKMHKRLVTSVENYKASSLEQPSIQEYVEGIVWQMNLLRGRCTNFDFHYPYFFGPRVEDMKKVQPKTTSVAEPLRPLQFCLALTHLQSKDNINPIFHPILNELPHFSEFQHISLDAWKRPDALTQLDETFKKYIDTSKLTEFENTQLSFQPTIQFTKSNNSIFLREEIFNTKNYTTPKHLETIQFNTFNSNRNNNYSSNNNGFKKYNNNNSNNRLRDFNGNRNLTTPSSQSASPLHPTDPVQTSSPILNENTSKIQKMNYMTTNTTSTTRPIPSTTTTTTSLLLQTYTIKSLLKLIK